MGAVVSLEAVLMARDAQYRETLDAVQACDAIRAHLMGEAPMAAEEVAAALETIHNSVGIADHPAG